ncbi:MAG: hypothetical protein JOZ48_14155 [Acidobacteriaceae bacterium]|nr:hypothetical protein [Acidobacteriaceae bacterium]
MSLGAEVLVFVGPTISASAVSQLIEAQVLPPASVGDIYRAAQRNPRCIILIDGYFEHTPAVWHKEILYAISRGIAVVGSSSMGALRAAELHCYGMYGNGHIYETYRDGICEDDDEVAVLHGDAESGYRCISDALVNIRHGLIQAHILGIISGKSKRLLERIAKLWYYGERNWAKLIDEGNRRALPSGEMTALRQYVLDIRPDLKCADAEETLSLVCTGRLQAPLEPPMFNFERTNSWLCLERFESTKH